MATTSGLLSTYSPTRDLIYATLIAQPDTAWSVRAMASEFPADARVSPDAVRANLYLLLAGEIVALVRGEHVLTLQLTAKGARTLRAILTDWKSRGLKVSP